jgi:hypothetical protein
MGAGVDLAGDLLFYARRAGQWHQHHADRPRAYCRRADRAGCCPGSFVAADSRAGERDPSPDQVVGRGSVDQPPVGVVAHVPEHRTVVNRMVNAAVNEKGGMKGKERPGSSEDQLQNAFGAADAAGDQVRDEIKAALKR